MTCEPLASSCLLPSFQDLGFFKASEIRAFSDEVVRGADAEACPTQPTQLLHVPSLKVLSALDICRVLPAVRTHGLRVRLIYFELCSEEWAAHALKRSLKTPDRFVKNRSSDF